MNTKKYTIMIVALLMSVASWAGNNILSVTNELQAAPGSQIVVPIELTNEDEIVAAQFNVTLPFDKTSGSNITLNATRGVNGHQLEWRALGGNKYTIVVYSLANKAIAGNSGVLVNIPIKVKDNAQPNEQFDITISDVVLTNRQGDNIQTGNTTGQLTIMTKPSPDLEVYNVSIQTANVMPKGQLTVNWYVKNIGDADADGGWSEKIYLYKSESERVYLGSLSSNETRAPGSSISRSATVALPELIGQEGDLQVQVQLVCNAGMGEFVANQGNNTALSDNTVNVGKRLFLTADRGSIDEGSNGYVRMKLSRSGYWDLDETFDISTLNTGLITVPSTVTIPQGQSGVYFNVTAVNNNIVNATDTETITAAAAHGYEAVSSDITVNDDEFLTMTLSLANSELTEGESTTLTIQLAKAADHDQVVTLSSELPKRIRIPSNVTIPAGQTTATVQVEIVDDDIADNVHAPFIYAVADNYNKASVGMILNDNDMPEIQLEFTPTTINEGAGPTAIMAKLKRLTATNAAITIHLSQSSGNHLYMPTTTIRMEKGVTEAQFTLGAIDNGIVDGNRVVTVTASVYVASCSCNATGTLKGIATQEITILDDDGPSLAVTSSQSGIREGDETGTVITVKRNTGTSGALTVNLSCDDPRLVIPATVTIPNGASSVTVTATAAGNEITKDTKTVVITASASGYANGMGWLQIVDETLADAIISDISVAKTTVGVNEEVNVSVVVENKGVVAIPSSALIEFRLGATVIDTLFTSGAIEPGASRTVTGVITMPDKVQTENLTAYINRDIRFQECLYINNESQKVVMTVNPPFTATVSLDKAIYDIAETVTISGQISNAVDADDVADKKVEVYVINEGRRETLTPTTDAEGHFTTNYTPTVNQLGHFLVGACYPGQKLTDDMETFDILGLRRQTNEMIQYQLTGNQPVTGAFVLYNPSNVDLTNVRVERITNNDDVMITFSKLDLLGGGLTKSLSYTIEGITPHNDQTWRKEEVRVISDEGATFTLPVYYYTRAAHGVLLSDVTNLKTTMIADDTRTYNITVTNTGAGPTGKLTLQLPSGQSWMKAVTPTTMPSLDKDEQTTVTLSLSPTPEMQLNVPVTGSFAINAENANGITIPFRIVPVSGVNGDLVIDVCDEFTYYDASEPRVSGAEVVVRNPITNQLVTQQTTGEDGRATFNLPSGYYNVSVTADKHNAQTITVLVDPETTTTRIVNLKYQAITVTWEVVETEVEDVYEIKTVVKYETNVPKPVVELILPDSLSNIEMIENGQVMAYAIAVNRGLITAKSVNFRIEDIPGCGIEYFVENGFDLAPGTSVVIPFRVYSKKRFPLFAGQKDLHLSGGDSPGFESCAVGAAIDWLFACQGSDESDANNLMMNLGNCVDPSGAVISERGGRINFGSGGGLMPLSNGWGGGSSGSNSSTVQQTKSDCNPCHQDIKKCIAKAAYCAWKNNPGRPNFSTAYKAYKTVKKWKDLFNLDCPKCNFDNCLPNSSKNHNMAPKRAGLYVGKMSSFSIYDEITATYLRMAAIAIEAVRINNEAVGEMINEYFGDPCWLEADDLEMELFFNHFEKYESGEIDKVTLINNRPSNVTIQQVEALIDRIANFDPETNEVMLDGEDTFDQLEEYAKNMGYLSLDDLIQTSEREYKEAMEDDNDKSSVCATISLQINQTMTMTRQAFLGTLTVTNGHETKAMTDVKLDLVVTNDDGDVVTSHEFQINPTSLDGFTGNLNFTDGWELAPLGKGTATVTFIPTKYAAPDTAIVYSFGGRLSYTNPYTGATVTQELFPVQLTVKPSPELDLTYFMQRDILGDNPLTPDVIEPSVPSEFALLINNKGRGDATKVKIVTDQPQIIDNEKGLLVNFEILSSSVNGKEKTLALNKSVASDFGTIAAGTQMYAQWELLCDLLGHFVDYQVSYTHVTSYDNPDLSLLDEVTIHEMIHSIRIPAAEGDSLVGWLVNDIEDAKDAPDAIYFSNATVQPMYVMDDNLVAVTPLGSNTFRITLSPEREGWAYCNIQDPALGKASILRVTRASDNANISLHNFWLTEWTIKDGAEPLHEYRLHFADSLTVAGETYTVEYMPMPDVVLAVESISGPDKSQKIEVEPLTKVQVMFNKPVNVSTFTIDDLSMRCQGKNVDLSTVSISTDDARNFTLDMGSSTLDDGYYVLKVATNNITDTENFQGDRGQSLDWIQYEGGFVNLKAKVTPEASGDIRISYFNNVPATAGKRRAAPQEVVSESGELNVLYGNDVTLTAMPKVGYIFEGWYLGEELLGTEPTLVTQCVDHTTIKAKFYEKNSKLTVNFNAHGGSVIGGGSGTYPYGTPLELRALATDGYLFMGWIENNHIISTNERLAFTVAESRNLTAEFVMKGGRLGDVNIDKFIDINDITSMASIVLVKNTGNYSVVFSDMNSDNIIDVNDITLLVNLVTDGEENSAKTVYFLDGRDSHADNLLFGFDDIRLERGQRINSRLTYDGVFNFCNFQFDIDMPDGIIVEDIADGYDTGNHILGWNKMPNGQVRVLCYSMTNATLSFGDIAAMWLRASDNIADGEYAMKMKNIIMGRRDGSSASLADKTVKLVVGNGTTGIENVNADNANNAIYDLQGRKVSSASDLSKGMYIINGKKHIKTK